MGHVELSFYAVPVVITHEFYIITQPSNMKIPFKLRSTSFSFQHTKETRRRRNKTTASASSQSLDFNPTIIIYFISNVSYGDKGTLYDSHTMLLSSKIRESMTVLM